MRGRQPQAGGSSTLRRLSVALATSAGFRDLTPDDRLLVAELRRRGAEARPAVWDDESVAWTSFDAVVLRSCWDYHLRVERFLEWTAALEARGVELWNPAALVRANADKSYLRGLQAAGIPVLPTAWLARGSRVDLGRLLDERGWSEAVVKPAVSASAHRTARVSRNEAAEQQPALHGMLDASDVLVQLYAPEIAREGEWSFVFLDGRYSHGVVKRPERGDYRVQPEWGGTVEAKRPNAALVEQARRVTESIAGPWLYARVDGIERDGRFVLMELELIEPYLFLGDAPHAAAWLADGVLRAAKRAARTTAAPR